MLVWKYSVNYHKFQTTFKSIFSININMSHLKGVTDLISKHVKFGWNYSRYRLIFQQYSQCFDINSCNAYYCVFHETVEKGSCHHMFKGCLWNHRSKPNIHSIASEIVLTYFVKSSCSFHMFASKAVTHMVNHTPDRDLLCILCWLCYIHFLWQYESVSRNTFCGLFVNVLCTYKVCKFGRKIMKCFTVRDQRTHLFMCTGCKK